MNFGYTISSAGAIGSFSELTIIRKPSEAIVGNFWEQLAAAPIIEVAVI
jgi:hypothetical protein